MYVPGELYRNREPGLNGTDSARKVRVHGTGCTLESGTSDQGHRAASRACPVFMRNRSRMRIAWRLAEGLGGASSGKNFRTWSSRLSFPAAIAKPTAVEVKLLLSEYSMCGVAES